MLPAGAEGQPGAPDTVLLASSPASPRPCSVPSLGLLQTPSSQSHGMWVGPWDFPGQHCCLALPLPDAWCGAVRDPSDICGLMLMAACPLALFPLSSGSGGSVTPSGPTLEVCNMVGSSALIHPISNKEFGALRPEPTHPLLATRSPVHCQCLSECGSCLQEGHQPVLGVPGQSRPCAPRCGTQVPCCSRGARPGQGEPRGSHCPARGCRVDAAFPEAAPHSLEPVCHVTNLLFQANLLFGVVLES